jgi:hypothetical protein
MERSEFNIKVFIGGVECVQYGKFMEAAKTFQSHFPDRKVNFTYLQTSDIRSNNWTERQFVQIMSDSDAHIFLSHPLQGQVNRPHTQEPWRQFPWDAEVFLEELQHLKMHAGFPFSDYLFDPAFTQDKYKYLFNLSEYTIPTIRVSLRLGKDGQLPQSEILRIKDWMPEVDEGAGFVLKLPFTTNSQAIKYPKTLDSICEGIFHFYNKFKDKIHYAILQPCLQNRKEYKLVFLNGEFTHVAIPHKEASPSKAFGDPASRQLFAEECLAALQNRMVGCLFVPIFRIDIMYYKGKMVLNEIESLEAMYEGTKEGPTSVHLEEFWYQCIKSLVVS